MMQLLALNNQGKQQCNQRKKTKNWVKRSAYKVAELTPDLLVVRNTIVKLHEVRNNHANCYRYRERKSTDKERQNSFLF